MPENKKTKSAAKESESVLVAAAKAIGSAAGTVASTLGVHEAAATPAPQSAPSPGKLVKKNKSRLPRREKKALGKAAAKRTA